MITGLNHIGVAVKSIDESIELFHRLFGAEDITVGDHRSYPEMGQTSCLIRIGDFNIELMEQYGDVKGTVGKFLEKHGPGLHHISLKSDDLDADDEHLQSEGVHVLGKSPKEEPERLMFTHPKETGSIVFEIAEVK